MSLTGQRTGLGCPSAPVHGASFAGAYAERVLQHVAGVEDAVAEPHRVLSPGSRVVAFEPDQDLRAMDLRLFREAGFAVESVEGTATGQPISSPPARIATAVQGAIDTGQLEQARGAAYVASVKQLADAGTLFSVWIAFEIIATRVR